MAKGMPKTTESVRGGKARPDSTASLADGQGARATQEHPSRGRHDPSPHPGPLPEGGGAVEGAVGDIHGQTPDLAPHLAAVAAQIAEAFPLVLEHTSLVLLDVDPGHLHAFWTLAPEDLARARAAFPGGGGVPEAVIQLQRLHAGGGAEVLATLPLGGQTQGDARFALANDNATYRSEIGLRRGDGGWVLLTRSNQARLPRPVGVAIPVWTGEEPPPAPQSADARPPEAKSSAPEPPRPPSAQAAIGGEGTPAARPGGPAPSDAELHLPRGPASPPAAAGAQPPEPGTRPARWVLALGSAGGLAQEGPTAGGGEPSPSTPVGPGPESAAAQAAADARQPQGPAQPTGRVEAPWAGPGPAGEGAAALGAPAPTGVPAWTQTSVVTVAGSGPAPVVAEGVPGPAAGPEPSGPVSSFVLGRGPETPVIEAELLVHVSAQPGTLVDLYGRPLRVGPSGRSSLRVPVTDLTLLERLLGRPTDREGPGD